AILDVTLLLSLLVLLSSEEAGDHEVTDEPRRLQCFVCQSQLLLFEQVWHLIAGLQNLPAVVARRLDSLRDVGLHGSHLGLRLPVEAGDLLASQTDERVAFTQRMIEKRERMVLRQGRQPERELG